MNKRSFVKALGVALALPESMAWSQSANGRPVRVVVPLPAGSSNDYATRVLLNLVGAVNGQNYFVDNKPGGNGGIGTMDVVRSVPDGFTLLCGSNSPLAANVAFVKNMGYDPRKDLTPIAGVSLTNHVLMVKSDSQIRTLAEFIAYAKTRPGKVSVGYSTTAVQTQIATMNHLAGLQLLPIPYRGSPATITDVIGGSLDATLTDPGNAQAQVKAGQLRALAVTSLKRNPTTPDWPAISETLPGFDFPSWNAIVGPAGMSSELVARVSDAVMKVQKQKELIEKFANHGTTPLVMGPGDLKSFIESETTRWVRLARDAKILPE
ncbi:Tripartite-type tricarboxylate transporter, receptor component TctC [Variovorax sp. YR266]|uniref:Bug family tripartite tricarboxylate transporter substrate binding protein n=1 Tax=Variovorax sp. YR266 TaxID=1884386 RepID=UPI000896D1AA|nr:tripartite tricarboxylate transporter substrate binding protein [Variovorax sp. YR266]SDZ70798.1 Tripartite-type tricarboxylate transporter, receptor component TctC [Variovorax sp. YR266]